MTDARPALTLLPGWAYGASVWVPIRTLLEQHWATTALDLPYEMPAETWLDPQAEWLNSAQPGWFLGWSLGGTLALALAARGHPKVQGVVMLASTPCWLPVDDPGYGLDEAALNALNTALVDEGTEPTLRRFNALVSVGAERPQAVQALLRPHLLLGHSPQSLFRGLTFMRATDLRAQHSKAPVVGIWGQGDRLLRQGLDAAWLSEHCSPALTLLQAGHAVAWSQPDGFVRALRQATEGRP